MGLAVFFLHNNLHLVPILWALSVEIRILPKFLRAGEVLQRGQWRDATVNYVPLEILSGSLRSELSIVSRIVLGPLNFGSGPGGCGGANSLRDVFCFELSVICQ